MNNMTKETRIFALRHGNEVFVGRSRADKLSAVVYKHLRGKHLQTKNHFDKTKRRPELYILESVTGPSALTYRNWLAWIHFFDQEGYLVINRPEVLEASRDLHPQTAWILERIRKQPLQEHLEKGHQERYADADRQSDNANACSAGTKASATVTLSVRMTPDERKMIQNFAAERNLSLRLALQYMAGRAAIAEGRAVKLDESLQRFQASYHNLVQTYKDRDGILRAEVKKLREEKHNLQKRSAERMEQVRAGIHQYMEFFSSASRIPMELEKGNYHQYIRASKQAYHYPTERTGFAVVRPQALLYGKGTVRFLVATDSAGDNLKLRYYPNKHLAGISVGNPEFGRRGSVWLIGWEAAEENVRELRFALPLEIRPKTDDPMRKDDAIMRLMREVDSYN